MRRLLALPCSLLVFALASCGSDSDTASSGAVAIVASDDACEVADTSLEAGATTFEIENTGKQVTEVYVYAPGDKIVTERENIGPGTKASMKVDLAAGKYEIACKPGQTGDGIREHLHVSGEGGKALETEYDREVEFSAEDFKFAGLETFSATKGEAIEFKMHNTGAAEHEFEVFSPNGEVLGEIGPTKPAATGEVILKLTAPGTYSYICDVENHRSLGMTGKFTVA